MSFILSLIFFYFLFKVIGGIIANFLLNSGAYQNNSHRNGGNARSEFQKIFQEMFNNLNRQQSNRQQSNYYSSSSQKQQSHNNANTNSSNSGYNNSFGGRQSNAMARDEACEILGVNQNASQEEIKASYRKLMLKHHPDYGGSKYFSQKINEAKKILLNE